MNEHGPRCDCPPHARSGYECHLTSACSSMLAGMLVCRPRGSHHRAMLKFEGSARVLLKRSVRRPNKRRKLSRKAAT